MRRLKIVGIGTGDPDHLTLQAVAALQKTDVFLVPDKGDAKAALRDARLRICERHLGERPYRVIDIAIPPRSNEPPYREAVHEWHAAIARRYGTAMLRDLGEFETASILVWGDPSLYDSTIRIVDALRADGLALDVEVLAGISSVQALAASHGIVLNRIGEPVTITTGRRLASGFPEGAGSVVVMLDGQQTFATLDEPDLVIYWGAYLGTPDEILISGRLADVREAIATRRAEARARHGWIMDIYLLRRDVTPPRPRFRESQITA